MVLIVFKILLALYYYAVLTAAKTKMPQNPLFIIYQIKWNYLFSQIIIVFSLYLMDRDIIPEEEIGNLSNVDWKLCLDPAGET